IFAQVLDAEGRFRQIAQSPTLPELEAPSLPQPRRTEAMRPPFPLPLDSYRSVSLSFPPDMSASDLEILEKRLQFEIHNGMLWRYLGLKKSAQSSAGKQDSADTGKVVPIRPLRES